MKKEKKQNKVDKLLPHEIAYDMEIYKNMTLDKDIRKLLKQCLESGIMSRAEVMELARPKYDIEQKKFIFNLYKENRPKNQIKMCRNSFLNVKMMELIIMGYDNGLKDSDIIMYASSSYPLGFAMGIYNALLIGTSVEEINKLKEDYVKKTKQTTKK